MPILEYIKSVVSIEKVLNMCSREKLKFNRKKNDQKKNACVTQGAGIWLHRPPDY